MKASERVTLREHRGAEWRAFTDRLADYTPLPAQCDGTDSRFVLWTFSGRAVLTGPPTWAAPLGPWAERWYFARRDANLLGRCPICAASTEVADMSGRPWRGQMAHESRCPVGDDAARRLLDTPFPTNDRKEPIQ